MLDYDVLNVLRSYRCQYTEDENNDALELVDVLTPPGDTDIKRGQMELELLADAISAAVADGLTLFIEGIEKDTVVTGEPSESVQIGRLQVADELRQLLAYR